MRVRRTGLPPDDARYRVNKPHNTVLQETAISLEGQDKREGTRLCRIRSACMTSRSNVTLRRAPGRNTGWPASLQRARALAPGQAVRN